MSEHKNLRGCTTSITIYDDAAFFDDDVISKCLKQESEVVMPKVRLLLNNCDLFPDLVVRSVSAVEVGGGVLIITTTKTLDPVTNTYKFHSDSTTFVPNSVITEPVQGKSEVQVLK